MQTIQHLVPIDEQELFNYCLSQSKTISLIKQRVYDNCIVEYELLLQELQDYYDLGQFAGLEKGRRYTAKVLDEIKNSRP